MNLRGISHQLVRHILVRHILLRSGASLLPALILAGVVGIFFAPTSAQAQSCAEGTLGGFIENDTTLSGPQFMDANLTVRNGATLTLTAGTEITVCGEHLLWVQSATLIADGTEEAPIRMEPAGEDDTWRGIQIGGGGITVEPSQLRYLEVIRGGDSTDPDSGAIDIYAPGGTVDDGPVLDHVTVRDSAVYGLFVRVDDDDDTPLSLSNLTVEGSASAPLAIYASAVSGLGTGNSFSANGSNVIEVRGGTVLGGRIYFNQTWPRQPVPFYVPPDNQIAIGDSNILPEVTIAAGNEFHMDSGAWFRVTHGSLVVDGTADEPVRMTSPSAETMWRGIAIGGGGVVVQPSQLRHLEVIRAGASNDSDMGAIDIYAPDGTAGNGPVLDYVTVRDSAAYGIFVRVDDDDDTPLSLSNLTVEGSASAPLAIYASAMLGLGTGNSFSDNGNNAIELRGGNFLGGRIYYSQTWPRQPVPFYLPPNNTIRVSDADNLPVVTIAAGNVFEMDEEASVWVTHGGLIAEGTAAAPVTFRRAGNEPWRQILIDDRFSPSASRFDYVEISGAGSEDGALELSDGELSISQADIRNNLGPGVRVVDGFVRITDSALTGNRVGAEFVVGSGGILRNNDLSGNTDGGVDNNDSRGYCVDAIQNFWGSGAGPNDTSAEEDDCGQAISNSGGTPVSDNVRYTPWLGTADGSDAADTTLITPSEYWAIGDGVATVTLDLLVRDAAGVPLTGKVIELVSTHGELTQPAAPTDDSGRTTATLRAGAEGNALITARNVTDDAPLSAVASVFFWQGPGDDGGLIDPDGAPYAAADFVVEGEPFQAGIPLIFRLPMQNTNSTPIDVSVSYAATDLGIGQRFTPVASVMTRTLAPGERWDAAATWEPTETGHQCVQATLTYNLPDGEVAVQEVLAGGSLKRQRNLNNKPPDDPCDAPDANKLIPTKPGLGGVLKHAKNAVEQAQKVDKCLQTLGSSAANVAGGHQDGRDYQVVATPPDYAPPTLATGPEVNQAQADAGNALAAAAAEVAGLRVALGQTIERAQWAGQADDIDALRTQLAAYQDYRAQLRTALLDYADAIDGVLAVTLDADVPDVSFSAGDYAEYLADLQADGYDADTVAYYETSGLTQAEIAAMLQEEIDVLSAQLPAPTTFYALLAGERDAARATADTLPAMVQAAADSLLQVDEEASTVEFEVSNPTDETATVDLSVRPVALPAGWSYELDNRAPELEAGASTTVGLTVYPSGPLIEGTQPQLAVEGFIGSEFIGGVLVRAGLPLPEEAGAVYLPVLQSE